MKVILLKDIPKIGKKMDIKEVSEGYARNFLLAKGWAKPANQQSIQWAKEQKSFTLQVADAEIKKVAELAQKLDGALIEIPVKVGNKGQLFEHINQHKIAQRLRELGYDIQKATIELPEDIKIANEHAIKINYGHGFWSKCTIIVKPV